MKAFLTALAAGVAIFMAQTASATQYVWRSAVRTGLFSDYNCWQYKNANNVYQPADESHHLTEADDFSFWLNPSSGIYYVTNDTSIAFNGGQFSFGRLDFADNLSTKSGTDLRIGTSGTAPYLAVVNKHDGNWTIGRDLYIGRVVNNYGVLTNLSGNITATSGWIYLGGNVTGGDLPNTTGTLVNVSGTISAKAMIIGGSANNTSGLLEVRGGKVTMTGWENFGGEWCGVMMASWGGARGEIRVAKGAVMELTSRGANIGLGGGTNVVTIDGTLKLPTNGKLVRIDKETKSTGGIHIIIGKTGRLECQSVVLYNDGGSGGRRLTMDGGTFAPSGNAENPMSNLSLVISDNNGTIEVPSGKTIHTGAWVMDATATSKGRVVKTGAGTLDINNWFRPSGGLRVNAGTVQMTHTASANFDSFNYPLSISKTGTVTGGAFVMGSGGSLEFEFASKASGETMNITTSFTRNANIPITFSTESAFGFDETYTLVKGGKIANTNNFTVASAAANGVDITDGVYLAVESGNLVLKRKPYFYIKVAEIESLEIPKSWTDLHVGEYDGETESFITAMTTPGVNGIPVWQSYCLGLNPQDAQSVVLCEAAETQPAAGQVRIAAKNLNVPASLSDVAVTASIDRKSSGDWEQIGESLSVLSGDSVAFTVDADPETDLSFFV